MLFQVEKEQEKIKSKEEALHINLTVKGEAYHQKQLQQAQNVNHVKVPDKNYLAQ